MLLKIQKYFSVWILNGVGWIEKIHLYTTLKYAESLTNN